MIQSIIFDIGNVLLPFDFSTAVRKLQQQSDVVSVMAAIEPAKIAYESGHIDRKQFLEKIRSVLLYSGEDSEFVDAWEDIFEENTAMFEVVQALSTRYSLYLLSNTCDLHVDYIFRRYPIFRHFKDAVYSYRVRQFKPDPGIYETALRQFGVKPEETVFIDDLPANVESALKLGIRAILYDRTRHEEFLNALSGLGIEIPMLSNPKSDQ